MKIALIAVVITMNSISYFLFVKPLEKIKNSINFQTELNVVIIKVVIVFVATAILVEYINKKIEKSERENK